MGDATDSSAPACVTDGLYIHRCSTDPDRFIVQSGPDDSASTDWAWVTISPKRLSDDCDIVELAVLHSTEYTKRGCAGHSRSRLGIALETALAVFSSSIGFNGRNHVEILASRDEVDSDWPTWLHELMSSPTLDDILKSLHTIQFRMITKHVGGCGQSEEIYTIRHPNGPNGMANTITAECMLMAEHLDRLAYVKTLDIPGWTIIVTKLHVMDPLAESFSLIHVTHEDTTAWTPFIDAIFAHSRLTSLRIPGILSKHLGEFQYMWAIMTKQNLEFLDLGGEHERWNSALEMCKYTYQYTGRLL